MIYLSSCLSSCPSLLMSLMLSSTPSISPPSLSYRFTFSVFFTLNLFMWGAGSSAAVPFTTILVLLFLWLGISLPLTFFGGFLGSRKSINLFAECGPSDTNVSRQTSLKQPVCTEEIPFKDPPLNWKLLSRSILSSLAGGFSVFSCIFIQLFYIHISIW